MKSLKEFIAENLENITVPTVKENQEPVVSSTTNKTVEENTIDKETTEEK